MILQQSLKPLATKGKLGPVSWEKLVDVHPPVYLIELKRLGELRDEQLCQILSTLFTMVL